MFDHAVCVSGVPVCAPLLTVSPWFCRQECNSFLQSQVPERDSVYQSRTVPIPLYPPTDRCRTFVGRLANQLLLLTAPRSEGTRSRRRHGASG